MSRSPYPSASLSYPPNPPVTTMAVAGPTRPHNQPQFLQPLPHGTHSADASGFLHRHHYEDSPISLPPISPYPREQEKYTPAQPARHRMTHPLHMSEQHPSAPLGHVIYPPDQSPHSLGADMSSRNGSMDRGPQSPSFHLNHGLMAQPRMARKIGQRRNNYFKEDSDVNRLPAAREAYYGSESASPTDQKMQPYPDSVVMPTRPRYNDPSAQRSSPPARKPSSVMQISGLLSAPEEYELAATPRIDRELIVSHSQKPQYIVSIRQQPIAARACGFGERDRRVIDPPPIVQLSINHPSSSPNELSAMLRNPFLVVHCTLFSEDGTSEETAMPSATDRRQQRRLMGTLVASPFVGRDENDEEGCFFCFPDLSCRTPGRFRLRFQLIVLDPTRMLPGNCAPTRASVMTDAFQVFNAKDFPGMRASTKLTKQLKEQGCLISVKRGNDRSNLRARNESDDDEDGGPQALEGGQRSKRSKR